ncbi:uracil-DNA glycosylase [Thermodesulfovibrio thiophilus]|uniref:uracil-DNA glycosylase n=1 Tax=Thermodesulfovibrio thiophilus TaxID=340095 RepID=UPI0004009D85|nr:uracil-DNA glycosylase [Thermodesulfovibrio thiophilus]
MGREITNIVEILNFYQALGFRELPINFFQSLIPSIQYSSTNIISNQSGSEILKEKNRFTDKDSLTDVMDELNKQIKHCIKCTLSNSRTHPVCGEGDLNSDIMFVGEAPGVEEDLQGKPFVGEAGKLLTSLIEKIGFTRKDIYITNTVKCHPPKNREPFESEISTCFDYLKKEIEIVKPKVIMTLGKVATFALMGAKGKIRDIHISKIRGQMFYYNNIPVIPTFHPAYLLRNRKDKWLTWEDAQQALRRLK